MVLSQQREFLKNYLYGGNGTKCIKNLRVVMFHSSIEKGEKVNLHDYPGNTNCIKTNVYESFHKVI